MLKQAKEALETLSEDPSARIQAEMREMALISYKLDMGKVWRDGLAEGRAEGRAEGEARGRAEGKVETLRKLLTFKFGELPRRSRDGSGAPANRSSIGGSIACSAERPSTTCSRSSRADEPRVQL